MAAIVIFMVAGTALLNRETIVKVYSEETEVTQMTVKVMSV